MKVFKKLMVLAMATVMTATCASALAACSGTTDGSFEGGDYKPSADGTTVQFWGYGDEAEVEVFGRSLGRRMNISRSWTLKMMKGIMFIPELRKCSLPTVRFGNRVFSVTVMT